MSAHPPKPPDPLQREGSLATTMEGAAQSAPVWHIRDKLSDPVIASFVAGGMAGAVSRTVVSPLERLKILLQVQSGGVTGYESGVWKSLQKIWQEEGLKGMMAGNGTNCIRIVPYSAVQFGSYNIYKPLVSASQSVDVIWGDES